MNDQSVTMSEMWRSGIKRINRARGEFQMFNYHVHEIEPGDRRTDRQTNGRTARRGLSNGFPFYP